MFRNWKAVTGILVLSLFSLLLFAGCAAPTAPPPVVQTVVVSQVVTATPPPKPNASQRQIIIGWTPPDITGVFRTATDYFNQSAADANKNGFNVLVVTRATASHTAFADQVSIIEDFIQRKVDAIVISPIDVDVIKPEIKKANDAGIPVIIVNLLEPIPDVKVASYIGFDNTNAAEISAYAVANYFGGPGPLGSKGTPEKPETYLDLKYWQDKYSNLTSDQKAAIKAKGAIIEGIAGDFFSVARVTGFHKVIDQFPNIQIIGKTCPADWNREKGIKCAENILGANPPGTIDFIWAASNEMGLGAMLTAQRLGRTDVKIFTNDGTPESLDAIRAGGLVAETWHGFPEWGWYGTETAVKLACHENVPQTQDIRPRTEYKGNADTFYPEPKLEPIDWAAIKSACK